MFNRVFGAGTCDTKSNKDFADFCNKYDAYVKGLKSAGKQEVKHFESVPHDVPVLRETLCNFREDTPVQLLLVVWIYIMVYLCIRGQENTHKMMKETFEIRTNDRNR